MSSREDQLALADFVAGIGATFNDISDKTTSKGSGLKREKIDIKNKIIEVIKADNRLNMPSGASQASAPAVGDGGGTAPTPIPSNPLQPLPLNELLIPLPEDMAKRAPPVQQQAVAPTPVPAQPEFQFVNNLNSPLPQTPREMFIHFDKKLDEMTVLISNCLRRISDLEEKKFKKR